MGALLRTGDQRQPIEPALDVYELGDREPCVRIGHDGTPFLLKLPGGLRDFDPDALVGPILPSPRWPKILFAAVPVMIHTAWGFSLAPLSEASEQTGPVAVE